MPTCPHRRTSDEPMGDGLRWRVCLICRTRLEFLGRAAYATRSVTEKSVSRNGDDAEAARVDRIVAREAAKVCPEGE